MRNDGKERTGGPRQWRYAILSSTGERLNEEGRLDFGMTQQYADQSPEGCSSILDARVLIPVTILDLPSGQFYENSEKEK